MPLLPFRKPKRKRLFCFSAARPRGIVVAKVKRKPSKPAPARPATPPRRVGAALRRLAFRSLRHTGLFLVRFVAIALILLIVLASYLHIVGLPRPILDDILDRLADRGWHLRVDRLRLAIDRGFVASGVEVYESADAPVPFLKADSLSAAVSPFLLFRHATVAPVVELHDGRLRLAFGGADGTTPRTLSADGIGLRFSARGGELVFRDFSARCLGIRFRGHGAVYLGPDSSGSTGNPLRATLDALAAVPEPALRAIDVLNSIRFDTEPEARFTFSVYPDHLEANACAFHLLADGGGEAGGIVFDRFAADAAWQDSRLAVSSVNVAIGDRSMALSGSWDSAADVAEASVVSTLSPAPLLPALPEKWRQSIGTIVSPLDFPLRIEASVGPAAPADLAGTIRGSVAARSVSVHTIPLREASASFACNGPLWRVSSASVTALRDGDPCTLEIPEASFDGDAGTFSARVQGSAWPDLLLAVPDIPPDSLFRDIVERFDFTSPPEARMFVRGTLDPFDFTARGGVSARDVSLHGVPVDTVEGILSVTPRGLSVVNARLSRPEGAARGEVSVSFDDETVTLDADTTFAPRAICQLLGPDVEEFAAPFRMEGPCHSRLRGTLDVHNFARTDLVGHVDGQRLGYGPVETDTASADIAVRGSRIEVTGISARLWDGTVAGEASFFPVRTADAWHFEVSADARKIQLADLLAAVTTNAPSDMSGSASFRGYVSGDTGPAFLETLSGAGSASVSDGLLFKTRILSGLSAILQYVIPGFDKLALADARVDYTLLNGKLRTRDASIATPLFGVTAEGSCKTDRTLDFEVEVQLLRHGLFARVVQFVTSPVTSLLKFRLNGSLDDPHWSPVNLNPKLLLKLVTPSTYTSGVPAPATPLPVPESAR